MKQDQLIKYLKEAPFLLAPMASITNSPLRLMMRYYEAGPLITELISATGLEYKSQKTIDLLKFTDKERPIGAQLFGDDPYHLSEAAQFVQDKGYDFVDLNFGCPVPKVTKKGAGSAMLKNLKLMQEIFQSLNKVLQVPLTIKIRTGWDHNSKNADEVIHLASNEGIAWVAIHGRTRSQNYEGLSDWSYISEVNLKSKQKSDNSNSTKIPIIGNGDILSPKQALERLNESQCEGVMIGRGALKNPFIFKQALALKRGEPLPKTDLKADYLHFLKEIISLYCSQFDERFAKIQIQRLVSWISSGYPGASQLRKKLYQTTSQIESPYQNQSLNEVISLSLDFFEKINHYDNDAQAVNNSNNNFDCELSTDSCTQTRADINESKINIHPDITNTHTEISTERFLMGGHG